MMATSWLVKEGDSGRGKTAVIDLLSVKSAIAPIRSSFKVGRTNRLVEEVSSSNSLLKRVKHASSPLERDSPEVLSLYRRGAAAVDEAVKWTATNAVASLVGFESLPLKFASLTDDLSLESVWSLSMEQFRTVITSAIDFTKQLSEFSGLPLGDQGFLLRNAIPALLMAQLSLPERNCQDLAFLGMNKMNRLVFLCHFPEFKRLSATVNEVATLMAKWQPSSEEFALLLATVFFFKYDWTVSTPLARPDLVFEAHRRMALALVSTYGLGSDAQRKMSAFISARKLLLQLCKEHTMAIQIFAANRPELFRASKIFFDVYQSDAAAFRS